MLSSIVPQADYAEDQKAAKTILTTHVYYRGFQSGALVGLGVGLVRAIILRRQNVAKTLVQHAVLRSTGIGAVIGTGLMVVGLPVRMNGREDIEWNDRSYRLLANKPQEQVDDWTAPSTVLGLGATIFSGAAKGQGSWKVAAGGAGLGSLAGLGALMIFRIFTNGKAADRIRHS